MLYIRFCQRMMSKYRIAIKAEHIDIFHEPFEYYSHLKLMIKNAEKRICFASLYLGTGEKERELIDDIADRIKAVPTLKVHCHLDCLRGTRKDPREELSSVSLLTRLSKLSARVSLYHTPALSGWKKRLVPNRYNETLGLSHFKAFIVDDNVILTGANLGESYFTNRQDRYVRFRKCKELADFYTDFISAVADFSYTLLEGGALSTPSVCPVTESEEFIDLFRKRLIEFQFRYESQLLNECGSSADTFIYPLIQAGNLDMRQDENTLTEILLRFLTASEPYRIVFTTGYFNMDPKFENIIISTQNNVSIICAAPEANGFYKAKGLAGYIPDVYTWILARFFDLIKAQNRRKITVWMYNRPGWTYHAKGVWVYKPEETTPFLMTIGSPNYGYRSLSRDLESEVLVETSNKDLQNRMQKEVENLYKFTFGVEKKNLGKYNPSQWVKHVYPFLRNFF